MTQNPDQRLVDAFREEASTGGDLPDGRYAALILGKAEAERPDLVQTWGPGDLAAAYTELGRALSGDPTGFVVFAVGSKDEIAELLGDMDDAAQVKDGAGLALRT